MIVKAPNWYPKSPYWKKAFLAGAIDMGKAVKWQDKAQTALDAPAVIVLNPRRDDWDSSWTQDRKDPQFHEQVKWELDGMSSADIVLVVFTEASKAPVTLMELGLFYGKAVVCVEPGFYRKGNIDIVCEEFNIPKFEDLDDALQFVKGELK